MQLDKSLTSEKNFEQTAWKALKNLVKRFDFNEEEATTLMGDMPRSTYYKGVNKFEGHLNRDTVERISLLLGIYKSLRILFTDSAQAMSWIDRPNKLSPFNGIAPREYLMNGSIIQLSDVRRFLDFWRGY